MGQIANIIKGPATLIFAGGEVGYTQGSTDIDLTDEKIFLDDIQQIAGTADVRRTKAKITVKANLYESNLDNIKLALGSSASVVTTTGKSLNIDLSGDYPEGELVIYGKGPNNVLRTITFYSAKLIECGGLKMDASAHTVIPVTFQVLVDYDNYANILGKFEEEYTPASVVLE
jgi:hypothetical protein